jgi:hypothetical protein
VTGCSGCGNPSVFCRCWSAADWMLLFVGIVLAAQYLVVIPHFN